MTSPVRPRRQPRLEHQARTATPRWNTRRIVWRAFRNTIGAVVEAGAREARLLTGPPRGRRAIGSSRSPAGAR